MPRCRLVGVRTGPDLLVRGERPRRSPSVCASVPCAPFKCILPGYKSVFGSWNS